MMSHVGLSPQTACCGLGSLFSKQDGTSALPHSFSVQLSYYGLVLDLQSLGRDIFLLQALFGAMDFLGRATTVLLFRLLGRRMTQASSLALAGFCILANGLVPQGEVGPGPAILSCPRSLSGPCPCPRSRSHHVPVLSHLWLSPPLLHSSPLPHSHTPPLPLGSER